MPGMELTAQTFRQFEDSLDYRQQLALRAALGSNRLGLLPGVDFECKGVFVSNTYEIEHLKCLAILPSGKIIDVDSEVTVKIPMLYGDEFYLGITISKDELHLFERKGVPSSRPNYNFAIYSPEELKKKDIFPVSKFLAKDGVLSISQDYIVPCLFLSENKKFKQLKDTIIEKLETISTHPNLEDGDGKRSLLRYVFILKGLSSSLSVNEFILLVQELAQATDYFIISPNSDQKREIPEPDYYDIENWLRWVENYLELAAKVLDKVVLEDNSIDYDALLEKAKKELYDRLSLELLEKLPQQIKKEIYDEIVEKLKEFLPSYIQEKLNDIKKVIGEELVELLEPKLFDDLYQKLYEALYVAPEEDDEFMPMI